MKKADKKGIVYDAFVSLLDSGKTKPLYLFYGDDFLLQEECLIELRALLGQEWFYRSFRGDEQGNGLGRMMEEAKTQDFFKAKRLFYLRRAEAAAEWELELLADYLEAPDDNCILCLSMPRSKRGNKEKDESAEPVSKQGKVAAQIRRLAGEKGVYVDLKPLKERALAPLLKRIAGRHGLSFSDEAAHYLIISSGMEPRYLRDELDKLSLFFQVEPGNKRRISLEEVRGYVNDMRSGSVFDFTDCLARRELAKTLAELSCLSISAKEAPMLVGLMAYRYRILRLVTAAKRKGMKGAELLEYLGMSRNHGWLLERYQRQAAKYTDAEYQQVLERLLKLDLGLKRSKGKQEHLFFSFVQDII